MAAKENMQEKSLVRRLFSAEVLIFCVGVACVVYGIANGILVMQMFFGTCIIAGSVVLHFVRKTDWDAHWAELDRVKKAHEARMAEELEKKE